MRSIAAYVPVFGRLKRQNAVLVLLLAFACVLLVVTVIVLAALTAVAERTNALDDQRSQQTTAGMLNTFKRQMLTTVRDYGVWDDAARAIYGPDPTTWALESFDLDTASTDIFDTSFLLAPDDAVILAFRKGAAFKADPLSYLSPAFRILLDKVHAAGLGPEALQGGFVRTPDGVALVGLSSIRPASAELTVPLDELRTLVFIRHLDPEKVRALSENYFIDDLHLASGTTGDPQGTPIIDPAGTQIATLEWQSRSPGDAVYAQVWPYLLASLGLVGLFLVVLLAGGGATITRLREDERSARLLALRDRLSGLDNRWGLYQNLSALIERAKAGSRDVVLLYLDMDGFKEVNDLYGHHTGDQLIKSVSAGLSCLVPEGAVLARLGGDEFAIALESGPNAISVTALETMILEFFAEPFTLGERVVVVGGSIGRAESPKGTVDSEELLRRADMAMYRAKADGRGRVVAYHPSMDTEFSERKEMEAALRQAISEEDLFVVYQPVVDAQSHAIVGVEALVRWACPLKGIVPPDVFIPVAEATGLIDPLGLFVMREALQAARQWPQLPLSLNVSPAQFRNPYFLMRAAAMIEDSGIDPARITMEITEGYVIQNPARARDTIDALKRLGIKIALDDFGAGFSSIGYLRQFGFDRMKIDRSMITALDAFPKAGDMLQATIALASAFEIPVTAEGIETTRQANLLRLYGCDQLQGYLFSRPVPAEQITQLLKDAALKTLDRVG
ncbi:putative bifunctional diguanylate cyclase/phosphodiesterase [Pararhizobium sp.]|uniref:putative bifunctional diguanylate cyclase/phosphodiesterase n=1 Tax=Pararhizobium sp. TaxID=1977563 RepID=UPI002715E1B6|nr:EAL domain-containing protein [Pararhizobium sp.]MDO9415262.1 EAL domain-containing protein [Pararhizobium sp.]